MVHSPTQLHPAPRQFVISYMPHAIWGVLHDAMHYTHDA